MDKLRRTTPRWVIFLIDAGIVLFSISLAYMLRFNFAIPKVEFETLIFVIPIIFFVRIIGFILSRMYAGIVRFTSTFDIKRIFVVSLIGTLALIIANLVSYHIVWDRFLIPFSIIILEFLITVFVMTFSRLLVKILFIEYSSTSKLRLPVLIIGTGELALITKKTLDQYSGTLYNVSAFIDPLGNKAGKKIEDINIYNPNKIDEIINKYKIAVLVFATTKITSNLKNEIIDIALKNEVKILTIPEVSKWIDGELSISQLKTLKIEDLLGREPINLDKNELTKQLLSKTVLVTGAAGSIGREITIQLCKFAPERIILLDQNETDLHDLELELNENIKFYNYKSILGDITNSKRIEYIISRYKPDIIYHAAAYKHVPMMEKNPAEAILTNIKGTVILSDIAHKYKVKKFVMISTDKAVNPTNVMGASKRIAEIFIQSFNSQSETAFITTRFGNVLGSNGSVIPRFRKQIEEGGPVTVTHPDITRYFMTIPEACQLVLEAGAMGKGGEIFIFDMGKSIKIIDLAKKMIKLSGLIPDVDIQIKYTGLRPGEKIYEELLNDSENTIKTHHPQIMIAKVANYEHSEIENKVKNIINSIAEYDNYIMVKLMKEILPEFISKNSPYEKLDTNNQ